MHFKLVQAFIDEHFGRREDSPMVFSYPDQSVTVVFRTKEGTDEDGQRPLGVLCEVTAQRNVNDKILRILEDVRNGVYDDSPDTNMKVAELEEKMRSQLISQYCTPWDILPRRYHDFYSEIYSDLRWWSITTCRTARWISNDTSPDPSFSAGRLTWSSDGEVWSELPRGIRAGNIRIRKGLSAPEHLIERVIGLVESGDSEPMAHELLCEAVSLSFSYPRSALLIGVAAAETGVKHCIYHLQPETEWLLENMQSPYLKRLIVDYLPKLAVKNTLSGDVQIPEVSVVAKLKKAIEMRNKLAHGGKCTVKHETVDDILVAVRDLLYLLDYYCGHDWAIRHLSSGCKGELGLDDS
ncbi:MAG: hypothetical protein KKG33_12980 [candidate division Zixibacteria bacterium]|nr:hypothetical protein [candidate division Zixibacteria bacterium]